MTNYLKHNLTEKMKSKGVNVSELERIAGLKFQTVRNIIYGRSKKPSHETLNALAKVFDCTIDNLLTDKEEQERPQSNNFTVKDHTLFCETVEAVIKALEEKKASLKIEDLLHCIKEIYNYSSTLNPQKVQPDFIDWIIEKHL